MAIHQHLCRSRSIAFGALIQRKLIRIDWLIFVYPGLDVPACEIAPVATRKCSCPEAAHWRPLPVAIVDAAGRATHSWILKGKTERPSPRRARYVVLPPSATGQQHTECRQE